MKKGVICILIFLGCSVHVYAGGLYIREFGQPSQGTAGAGANLLAEDASLAFQNPAGVFRLEGDSEWMVTGIILDSSIKFDPDDRNTVVGNDGGDAGDTQFGGAVFYTRKLNEQWGAAFALNSVAGSALEYDEGFVGRYTGKQAEVITISLSPSVAYKINEELSVSIGVNAVYGELELKAAIPPFIGPAITERDGLAKIDNGDDYDITGRASILWQAAENWRLALIYVGESKLNFNSDLELTLPGPLSGVTADNIGTDVKVVFPQGLAASALYDVNDRWSVMARLGWEEWSRLQSVPVTTSQTGSAIPIEWDDVWSLAAGLRYDNNGPWSWYSGIAYDSDAGKPQTRVAILPTDQQWRLAGGVSYNWSEKYTIGSAITYIDLGSAKSNVGSPGGVYAGDFSTNRLIVWGFNLNWR
ncbi:MAG: outer membrane protein transport protein [Halioglobus sp.]|nr:outer membrane protein transport protein [Halioglobus sp.]